jgi:hypothetical protein
MTFEEWLNQDEGFGIRSERAFEDIKICIEDGRTDDIIKWLMAAYAMGHEQGYNAGYSDATSDYDLT